MWASIGHLLPPPLGQQEAPHSLRRPIQYIDQLQNMSGYQISVAVQLLARHLEVNCQFDIKCLNNFANYA